jgi:copper resistance protein C
MNPRIFIAAFVIACAATPAFAHAFLQHAQPGAGSAIKPPPSRVALTFSEKLEPVFSGVTVTDASGRNVEADTVVIRGNAMVAPLRPLPPGRYRVVWHAVSVDVHRTEGAYSFTVKP